MTGTEGRMLDWVVARTVLDGATWELWPGREQVAAGSQQAAVSRPRTENRRTLARGQQWLDRPPQSSDPGGCS